jgi:hypothetical protein
MFFTPSNIGSAIAMPSRSANSSGKGVSGGNRERIGGVERRGLLFIPAAGGRHYKGH